MIEMFKDKKMQKSMSISACIVSFLAFELFGLSDYCPWKWLTTLALVLLLAFAFMFFTIIIGLMIYAELCND